MKKLLLSLALALLFAVSGHAAVAFDACSSLAQGTGSPRSWTHTTSASPQGVIVMIIRNATGSEALSDFTVTYGGSSVAGVDAISVAGEAGSSYAYFDGTSIASGNQTVEITTGIAQAYFAAACTVTAGADTEVEDTSETSSTSVMDPSVTMTIATASFCMGGLYSGQNAPASVTAGTDTSIITNTDPDFGTDVGQHSRGTTIPTSDFTYGFTQAAEDAALEVICVTESSGAAAPKKMMTLGIGD